MGDKRFGFELPQLLILAWLFVLYTLLTPLLIFSVHRYRRVFNHPFIHCRRPKLVIICCILTILYCSIYSPFLLILTQFSWIEYSLTLETIFLFNSLPLLLISLHFSIRYFQVYYDLKYNSSMADAIWTQAINEKHDNFYIKYRTKFGTPRFQYIIFTIFILVLSSIIICIIQIFGKRYIYIAEIVILCALSLNIIPLIIIFKKLTTFLDAIKIRTELLWNLILSFIGIIVIATHSFIYIFVDKKHENDIIIYGYTIISVVTSIIYFCICYMMTLYIILQPQAQIDLIQPSSPSSHDRGGTGSQFVYYHYADSGGNGGNRTPSTVPNSSPEIANRMGAYSMHSVTSSYQTTQNTQNNISRSTSLRSIRLNHIFKNDDTFKLFIRHLAKEYCIENALFLFESQQFKKQCNSIETQMIMMNTRHSTSNIDQLTKSNKSRVSASKSASSMNSKRGAIYSKQRKNLLSVPTTVHEQQNDDDTSDNDEEDGKYSPHSPNSPISESDDRYDDIIGALETEQKQSSFNQSSFNTSNRRESGTMSRSQATKTALKLSKYANSNHYEGDNKILDFVPFHLIPQSQIIEKYQNDFEKIFLKLYDKYIDWKTSSFEINVSGHCRNKLHNIYVRITYQLLMEEREQLLLEYDSKQQRKSNFLNIKNGWIVNKTSEDDIKNKNNKRDKPRATVMWQSRKTIVNALKATITKQQMNDDDIKTDKDDNNNNNNNNDDDVNNMNLKVEIQEVVDVLTLAEQDIIRNLNDSLSRFKRTPEFRNWLSQNITQFRL